MSNIIFKDNETFNMVFESKTEKDNDGNPLRFYALKDTSKYHLSRYVSANAQNIYSESGITKTLLSEICNKMLEAVNNNKLDEVAVWTNNLKARMSYPVDENAAIRMAMIYHFVEGENPNSCENHWTEWKLKKVLNDPEAYSFFLPVGLTYTPSYSEYLEEISESYLNQRRMTINQLTPTLHQQE